MTFFYVKFAVILSLCSFFLPYLVN
uniref:Uncharacterized protein n=1 Tax=Rhizophora mucronata TaxID=61149 RepID=A0A2P2PAQ1_RHIMU